VVLGVTLDGWLLSLHVLSAFAVVGGLTSLLIALAAGRRLTRVDWAPPLRRAVNVGATALRAGLIGTLVFGLWLVLRLEGYSIWEGWILGSLLLWLVVGGLGDRSIAQSKRALAQDPQTPGEGAAGAGLRSELRSNSLLWFRVTAFAAAVAALALMVWKPGA
jgi:uncharacterized membrane protein